MVNILHKDLSYLINGLLFQTHKDIGRFRNEKQYSDHFEKLLKNNCIHYQREYRFDDHENKARCVVDFIIEDKIILEFKAKQYVTKEDYYQTRRYLSVLNKDLGLLVNFRSYRLYPKRVLNGELKNLDNLDNNL